MSYHRHNTDPGDCNLRAMLMPPELTGFDADLLCVMRRRAGLWVQVTPTITEITELAEALDGAEPGVIYWITNDP